MDKTSVLEGLAKQANVPVDDVPAKLTEGEYVIPADVVIILGSGDKLKGFEVLDNLVESARKEAQV
jgi:hypothetical protein